MNKKHIILSLLIIVILISGCVFNETQKISFEKKIVSDEIQITNDDNIIKIGVAAMLSPQDSLMTYEKIVEYIGTKLGKKAVMIFSKDYGSMNEMVKKQEVDAAFVCSGPYVSGHDEWGMELLAAAVLYNETTYYSYLIVHKNSNIKNIQELKGKKFAFTDPKSNTGALVPTCQLALINKKPEDYFSKLIFSGSHDKSIEAVALGVVDGAAVDHLIWEYMNKKNPQFTSQTKYIAKLGPYCIPPFVTNPKTNPKLKTQLKEILFDMNKDILGKNILSEIYIDKFVEVDDSCYKSVRDMENWLKTIKK